MKVIANCCLAGDLYKAKKWTFNTPFMWCHIHLPDMVKLIMNYDKINFDNYEMTQCNWNDVMFKPDKKLTHVLGLTVDNTFTAWYVHHIFSPSDLKPRIVGSDVYAKDIFSYLVSKYETRKERMTDEVPKFIMIIGRNKYETKEAALDFIKAVQKTQYDILIFTHFNELTEFQNEKIKVITDTYKAIDFPPNVLKKYSNVIDEFVGV